MSKNKNLMDKPDWLPNWQDLTQYPDPKKAIGRIWAWEFLRRNPKYQELWQEYAALPKSAGFLYHGSSVFEIRDRFEKRVRRVIPSGASINNCFRPQVRLV